MQIKVFCVLIELSTNMSQIISLLLITIGVGQFIWLKYSILSMLILVIFCFIGGLLGGKPRTAKETENDNIANLAQIERNRYLRKPE